MPWARSRNAAHGWRGNRSSGEIGEIDPGPSAARDAILLPQVEHWQWRIGSQKVIQVCKLHSLRSGRSFRSQNSKCETSKLAAMPRLLRARARNAPRVSFNFVSGHWPHRRARQLTRFWMTGFSTPLAIPRSLWKNQNYKVWRTWSPSNQSP